MIIPLIGQPNCGKSTIFNYFSGYKAVVSNFPGTTVNYNQSRVVFGEEEITCVDLPGVYSLTSSDQAELESRNYMLKGEAAVIINVIDASLLSRSLELTLELMSLERPRGAARGRNLQPGRGGGDRRIKRSPGPARGPGAGPALALSPGETPGGRPLPPGRSGPPAPRVCDHGAKSPEDPGGEPRPRPGNRHLLRAPRPGGEPLRAGGQA